MRTRSCAPSRPPTFTSTNMLARRWAVAGAGRLAPSESRWRAGTLRSFIPPLDGGALKQVCTIPHQFGRLSWSPDSASIAFVSGVMSDEGNIGGDVFVVSAAGGEARNITPGIDHSITWIDWREDGILYCARRIEGTVVGWIDPQTGERRGR